MRVPKFAHWVRVPKFVAKFAHWVRVPKFVVEECDQQPKKQGRYFRCVSGLTDDLKDAGVITRAQKHAILRCATRRR